jgi:hypothetical protein
MASPQLLLGRLQLQTASLQVRAAALPHHVYHAAAVATLVYLVSFEPTASDSSMQ